MRTADVVKAVFDDVFDVLCQPIKETEFVHDAECATLLAGPVVRENHDDGVVEHVHFGQKLYEATDLGIGMFEHRGERFLEAI